MFHDASLTTPCAWREALDALVADRMRQPFKWGVQDCCLWAADCVLATTGVDHAADVRGTYTDAAGALRVLAELGGIEVVGARAGDPIRPLAAAVGDVGLVESAGRPLLAVCLGAVWLAPAADGLAAFPISDALMAWRVSRA